MEKKIINWIKKQIKQSKTKGVVIGISGGIDSALTAALCCRALGQKRVLGLILPCLSQKQDIEDAYLVAKKLKLKVRYIDLSTFYRKYLKILPKANSVARANVKARLRMLTLYYFANAYNYLVCGTSNKSETLAGYFTKHGDGAADILPIGNLFKSKVRQLAEKLEIPERILTKAPTAGLWPNQTDESEMGITYAQLDEVLVNIEKGRKQKQSLSVVHKVKSRVKSSEHKRKLAAACPLRG